MSDAPRSLDGNTMDEVITNMTRTVGKGFLAIVSCYLLAVVSFVVFLVWAIAAVIVYARGVV